MHLDLCICNGVIVVQYLSHVVILSETYADTIFNFFSQINVAPNLLSTTALEFLSVQQMLGSP